MKQSLLFVFVVAWLPLSAQTPDDAYLFRQPVVLQGGPVVLRQPVSSVAISGGLSVIRSLRVVSNGDTLALHPDPHAPASTSQLLIFKQATSRLTLLSRQSGDTLLLTGIFVPPLGGPGQILAAARRASSQAADCEKPAVIPASVWRAGLPPPRQPPTATKVQFVIVHHEAGSNTTTDYLNVVRNIYVFHTQSNGWNDVGYNFLVAQDGTIFEGRDGRGIVDGDNVLGAHFCGTNTETMGVCLLGNYMTAQPDPRALASLNRLITWKLKKEGLSDPLGSGLHTPSGKTLRTVSAHRDGTCATDCPGNNLYALMEQIRAAVTTTCADSPGAAPLVLATEPAPLSAASIRFFPNPASGSAFWVEHNQAIVSLDVMTQTGQRLDARYIRETPGRWQVLLSPAGTEVLVRLTDTAGNVLSGRVVLP